MSVVFPQNVIAVIWDFDKTLIPRYMQDPLFRRYDVDPSAFWTEVNSMPGLFRQNGVARVSEDTVYLNRMLDYVRAGRFSGLTNDLLHEVGADLDFNPGVPEILQRLKDIPTQQATFKLHEVAVEHYIVSTGLRQIILGSAVANFVEDVWGCEFSEVSLPVDGVHEELSERVITSVAYALDNTGKTRAIFEINKGCNKHPDISVNAFVPPEHRRVPFVNMIYIADGPSDVPGFSLLRSLGGHAYAVYKQGSEADFIQAKHLQDQGRVDSFGPADFSAGTQTDFWLRQSIIEIAGRIVRDREATLLEARGAPPGHLIDSSYTPDPSS